MAGNKKLSYKSSLDVFMKNNFPSEKMSSGGLKLLSELLNDVNSVLISHIEKQHNDTSKVNAKNFHHWARNAIEENYPQDLKSNALSEAYKQLALLESGCLDYGEDAIEVKGKVEPKRKGTREEIESKRMEATIDLFKKGTGKIFSNMYPNKYFKVDKEALGPLALCIHGFTKMMAERASEIAGSKKELQPIDLKHILPEYLEGKALRVALSESNRCMALYENGLIAFKPKKTYESEWSQENIVSEKIFATVFKPGIKDLAKEAAPGCEIDVKAQKYLGHILMDIARYAAKYTSETCRREKISEMKDGEIHRTIGETFPGELKQHAQLKGSRDVMEFKSEMVLNESLQATERNEMKSEREPPKKQRKQARGKRSSPKDQKSLSAARKRKSTSSPKSSPRSKQKRSKSPPNPKKLSQDEMKSEREPPKKQRKQARGKGSSPKGQKRSSAPRKRKSTSSPKRSPSSKRKRSKSPKPKKLSESIFKKMKTAREEMSKSPGAWYRRNVPLDREAESAVNRVLGEVSNAMIGVARAANSDELRIEDIDEALRKLFPPELALHAQSTSYNALSLFLEKEDSK